MTAGQLISSGKPEYNSGVPAIWQIRAAIQSDFFEQLEEYSSRYLLRFAVEMASYRWIKDALHQWSRIYEYPFCYHHLRQSIRPCAKVMDGGCGLTFFPFLLSQGYDLTCVDMDDYSQVYHSIADAQKTSLRFLQADLCRIPLEAESFDAIYCISVLEHTRGYEQIIAEFQRLLKPGGLLLVTFDVALDGNQDGLSPPEAVGLIEQLLCKFESTYRIESLEAQLGAQDVYSTAYVFKWNESLLPWPRSSLRLRLRNMLRKPKYFRNSIQMTFCNLALQKPVSPVVSGE